MFFQMCIDPDLDVEVGEENEVQNSVAEYHPAINLKIKNPVKLKKKTDLSRFDELKTNNFSFENKKKIFF